MEETIRYPLTASRLSEISIFVSSVGFSLITDGNDVIISNEDTYIKIPNYKTATVSMKLQTGLDFQYYNIYFGDVTISVYRSYLHYTTPNFQTVWKAPNRRRYYR